MEQACTLDAKNGITLSADAISMEMKKVRVAFDVLPRSPFCVMPYGKWKISDIRSSLWQEAT